MKLMLDTNTCIVIINQRPKDILEKFSAYQVGDIYISAITLAELRYGVLRTTLEEQGTPIDPLDTMIGAHALSLNLTLVTNNTKEFSRIPGLKVIDWVNH